MNPLKLFWLIRVFICFSPQNFCPYGSTLACLGSSGEAYLPANPSGNAYRMVRPSVAVLLHPDLWLLKSQQVTELIAHTFFLRSMICCRRLFIPTTQMMDTLLFLQIIACSVPPDPILVKVRQ